MNFIIDFIKVSWIFFIANIICFITSKREKNIDDTVKLPRIFLIFSVIGYVIFHLPIYAYVVTNDYSHPEIILLFSIAIIGCLLLFLACINWKIEYRDDIFKYRTFLRHTLFYKYADVKKIKRLKSGDILIKVKKRWLFIDSYAVGQEDFIKKLIKYL